MSVPQVPLSELTANLMREVFQALADSANEQNAAFVELAAQVGVPLETYLETHIGSTTAEQTRSAETCLREVVFPLLSIPPGHPLSGLIPLTDDGRSRVIDHFRGLTAASACPGEGGVPTIEETIRPATSKGHWAVPVDVLVRFTLSWLRRETELSYRRARALLAGGLQKVAVTSGQVVTKVTFQVAARSASPSFPAAPVAGPARGRVRFLAAGEPAVRPSSEPGRRMQPLDLRVRVVNESVAQSADAVGMIRIDFRADSFPPVQSSEPPYQHEARHA